MAKPNFFVIGSAKCGTTSLCDLLSQHPDIFFCPKKEPNFFSYDIKYNKGLTDYETLFDSVTHERHIGEGSTTYSESWLNRSEKSADRIYDYCPDAKIIYCVRDPLERIESKWLDCLFAMDNGWKSTELIQSKALNIVGDFETDIRENPDFVNTSNYWNQLLTYQKRFPSENIKIVFFEDFKTKSKPTLVDICEFLNTSVDFAFEETDKARNATAQKGLTTGFGKIARMLPGYQTLAQNSPQGLKKLIFPVLKNQFSSRPSWDAELRKDVVSDLKADLHKFLAYCDKPADFWQSLS